MWRKKGECFIVRLRKELPVYSLPELGFQKSKCKGINSEIDFFTIYVSCILFFSVNVLMINCFISESGF